MPSDDYTIPDLPSDEELGIAGIEDGGEEDGKKKRRRGKKGKGDGGGGSGGGRPAKATPAGPAPRRPWRGPLTLVLLLTGIWFASSWRALPAPRGFDTPDTAFSASRARVDVEAVARTPHPPGSLAHLQVRGYLLERLRELGLEPQVQTATTLVGRGGTVRAATVRNVLARIPGTSSTGAIVLTAHYDSRTVSPGAGDDATGVAAILETVRVLQAREGGLRNDLIVLLTDGEELGLMGARAFVDRHPWMEDVAVVLALEMRGAGGPVILFETGTESGWIVEAAAASEADPWANSLSFVVYDLLANDTDFTPFREAGVQGLNLAAIGRAPHYHQAFDTPDGLSPATVQHHGESLLALVEELGDRELATVDAPDRVFLRVPWAGLVSWPAIWVHGISVLLLLLLGGAAVGVHRAASHADGGGRSPWGGVALGALLGLVIVAAGAGIGWALFAGARGLHPELGAFHGADFHREGPWVVALAAFTGAAGAVLLAAARRWASVAALTLGALLLPLAGAVALAFVAPLGAMNLQIPLVAALLAVLVVARRIPHPPGNPGWVLLLILAVPVVAVVAPLVEVLWTAVRISAAPILGGLVGLGIVLLLPLVETLRDPGRVWFPALATVVGAGCVALGVGLASPYPPPPPPPPPLYALDRTADPAASGPGTALWLSRPDAGLDWARSRVGGLRDSTTLEGFLLPDRSWLTAPAPDLRLPEPAVDVLTGPDPTPAASDPGQVRLGLLSPSGAELLGVILPPGIGAWIAAVNGVPVTSAASERRVREDEVGARLRVDSATAAAGIRADGVTRAVHHGLPDGAVEIDLRLPLGLDSLTFTVVEHHQRPARVGLATPFLRPPELTPNVRNLSDRVMVRTPVTVSREPGGAWTARGPARLAGAGGAQTPAAEGDTLPESPPDTLGPAAAEPDSIPPDTVPSGPGPRRPPG